MMERLQISLCCPFKVRGKAGDPLPESRPPVELLGEKFTFPPRPGHHHPEPVFVNVYGAQELIPRNWFRQRM